MADEEREPTEDELIAAMRPSTREFWRRSDLTPQQRAQMLQGARRLWKAAHRPTPKPAGEDIKRASDATHHLPPSQPSPFTQPSTIRVILSFLRKFRRWQMVRSVARSPNILARWLRSGSMRRFP